jgi:hypothetical protein
MLQLIFGQPPADAADCGPAIELLFSQPSRTHADFFILIPGNSISFPI